MPPVPINVDPAILNSFAGAYGIQQSNVLIQVKFEESKLWILSQDGKSWNRLLAETEACFFIHPDKPYQFEFIREPSGNVIALRLEVLGNPLLVVPKMLSE